MTETLRPTNDYVIIEPEYEKTIGDGTIVLPDEYVEDAAPVGFNPHAKRIALSSRTACGRVVSVGPGIPVFEIPEEEWQALVRQSTDKGKGVPPRGDTGQRVPIDDLRPGDRVVFERTSSAYLPDRKHVIVRYEAVWFVVDDETKVQTFQQGA